MLLELLGGTALVVAGVVGVRAWLNHRRLQNQFLIDMEALERNMQDEYTTYVRPHMHVPHYDAQALDSHYGAINPNRSPTYYAPPPTTAPVSNGGGAVEGAALGLLGGVLLGEALANRNEHETVVEREVVREPTQVTDPGNAFVDTGSWTDTQADPNPWVAPTETATREPTHVDSGSWTDTSSSSSSNPWNDTSSGSGNTWGSSDNTFDSGSGGSNPFSNC